MYEEMSKSLNVFEFCKKSVKISKGQPESVYRRSTYNTMAKRKGQTKCTKFYAENYRSSNTNPAKTSVNSVAAEGLVVPVPLVAPVMLLLNDT